jgi:hypothetical protein
VKISEEQADPWATVVARQRLEREQGKTTPAQEEQWSRERLALARRLKDRTKETQMLQELAYRHFARGEYRQAAGLCEEYAAAVAETGDVDGAAMAIAMAEVAKARQEKPESQGCMYSYGEGYLREKAGVLSHEGSARSSGTGYPPGGPANLMSDLLWLTPFDGIGLLNRPVGESCTDWHNTGIGGVCESMRTTSTLKSSTETVRVAAGCFSDCVLIETTVSTSREDRKLGPETEMARGYYAGVKEAWFAPGVGLVRLRYRHHNGSTTDVELAGYRVPEARRAYLPLGLDHRWRYCWTDPTSGTRFEDRLRVASHGEGRWDIAFVTCAETADPQGRA